MEGGDHREAGGQEWTVLAPMSTHSCYLKDVIVSGKCANSEKSGAVERGQLIGSISVGLSCSVFM